MRWPSKIKFMKTFTSQSSQRQTGHVGYSKVIQQNEATSNAAELENIHEKEDDQLPRGMQGPEMS